MPKVVNRARMATATTGTGTITLGAAATGFQTFAAAGVLTGDMVHYVIEDGTAWEVGRGIYNSTGPTLTRVVEASSNSNALLSLTGAASVFVSSTAGHIADMTRPKALARRMALHGHSVPAYTTNYTGDFDGGVLSYGSTYLHWMNVISGQRFVITHALNRGIAAETSTTTLSRFPGEILAVQDQFDILVIDTGTNDLYNAPTVTKENTYANIISMAQKAVDLGKFVIVSAIWPRADTAPKEYAYVNRRLLDWCRVTPGVVYFDPAFILADRTTNTGQAIAGGMVDNVHPSSFGSCQVGQYLWAVLEPFFAGLPTQWRNGADLYNATTNPGGNGYPNPLLTGTGGGVATGVATSSQGVIPNGITVYKNVGTASTASAVSSVAANTDGSPGNYHQFRFDAATGSALEEFSLGGWISLATAGLAVGDSFYGQVEMELVGPTAQLKGLEFRVVAANGSFGNQRISSAKLVEQVELTTTVLQVSGKFVVRTMPIVIPSDSTQVNFQVYISFDATLPAYALVRYSQPQIRKVI